MTTLAAYYTVYRLRLRLQAALGRTKHWLWRHVLRQQPKSTVIAHIDHRKRLITLSNGDQFYLAGDTALLCPGLEIEVTK